MPRPTRRNQPKSNELRKAEVDAAHALSAWLSVNHGRGSYLSRRTGMQEATISNMKSGRTSISMEAAILIEVATGHALLAENLCPSMALMLRMYRGAEPIPPADDELPRGLE
jgi:DNA-binding transcriptional regulator YdaS (Cro superfamily)